MLKIDIVSSGANKGGETPPFSGDFSEDWKWWVLGVGGLGVFPKV